MNLEIGIFSHQIHYSINSFLITVSLNIALVTEMVPFWYGNIELVILSISQFYFIFLMDIFLVFQCIPEVLDGSDIA